MYTYSFLNQYQSLLHRFVHGNDSYTEVNKRTGVKIQALKGSVFINLDLNTGKLPIPGNRKFYPRVAAAELAWQLQGTKSADLIMKYAPKMWGKFVDRDGEVEAAYGYRWSKHFGRDQLQCAIDALREDSTNRQIYISAWDPAWDGLGYSGPSNIPCPVGFSLNIVDRHLNCAVFLRSSDVFVGLPYDVMCYALLVDAIAAELSVTPGMLSLTLAHAHVYEPHFAAMRESVDPGHKWTNSEPSLPAFTVTEIQQDPDAYIRHMTKNAEGVSVHAWDPKPEVVL